MKSDLEGLLRWEESATLWLWAYQELIEWEHDLSWMFSPVTGNKKYPGDLWGVDDEGNLLLVETKRVAGQSKQDPFIDFVAFEKNSIAPTKIELRRRFKTLLDEELTFIRKNQSAIEEAKVEKGFYRGLVPYSSKRSAVRRWIHLYKELILPKILPPDEYLEKLERRLEYYPEKKEAIHYIGIVMTTDLQSDGLSTTGKENLTMLRKITGNHRVHYIQITAHNEPTEGIWLISQRSLHTK